MSWELFWHTNPRILESFIEADKEKRKREDYMNWLNGQYTFSAFQTVMAHFANKLGGGGHCDAEYIKQPLLADKQEEPVMSEEEKMTLVNQFFMGLGVMKTNFELEHKKEEKNVSSD